MQAINDYVVVNPIKEEPKNIGGFIVTESTTKDIRYLKGEIVSVGNLTQGINEGNIIYYDKHAGHSFNFDGNWYLVIRQRDVVLVE
jgi:chaperonin GroES